MIDEREFSALDGVRRLDDEWMARRGGAGTMTRTLGEPAAPATRTVPASAGDAVGVGCWAARGGDPDDRHDGYGHHAHGRRDRTVTAELAASLVVPGAAAWRRHPFVGATLALLGAVVPFALFVMAMANRDRIIGFALDPEVLLAVAVVALAAIVTRFAAIAEIVFSHRGSRPVAGQAAVATLLVVALAVPVLGFAARATDARSTLGDVFADDSGDPLYSPPAGASAVDPSSVKNILIIGGDAGPGRWGMRTDTMMLVSVHEASGRTALTSIPRNLTGVMFPPGTPLADRFPNGFDDLANAIFTEVNGDPAMTAFYGSSGMQPEAIALVGALGHSLGVEIDDFALVNMQGFADVIDAVGGVTVELLQTVPLPPTLVGERELPTEIGPGFVQMDGALAIAYARSREADSDYQRMGRQRQLLAAIGSQVSATEALGAFDTVTGVLDDSMRTSLSADEFDKLLSRLGDNSAIMESVGLAPPLITPGSPDWAQIAAIVDAVEVAVVSGQPSGFGA